MSPVILTIIFVSVLAVIFTFFSVMAASYNRGVLRTERERIRVEKIHQEELTTIRKELSDIELLHLEKVEEIKNLLVQLVESREETRVLQNRLKE